MTLENQCLVAGIFRQVRDSGLPRDPRLWTCARRQARHHEIHRFFVCHAIRLVHPIRVAAWPAILVTRNDCQCRGRIDVNLCYVWDLLHIAEEKGYPSGCYENSGWYNFGRWFHTRHFHASSGRRVTWPFPRPGWLSVLLSYRS